MCYTMVDIDAAGNSVSMTIEYAKTADPQLNCELLFVTLQKTEERFSPTTLYHDYAISEQLFHWQSQNTARPDRGKGRDYIRQQELERSIILFFREQSKDQHNRTMGFVCLGPVSFISTEGSQPMNITCQKDLFCTCFACTIMCAV